MNKPSGLTKGLAVVGTLLTGLPLVLPVLFGLLHWARSGELLIDFLMPAELFFVILAGGGLLILAAVRQKNMVKPLLWALGAAAAFLVLTQVAAQVTGVASSPVEVYDWRMGLIYALLAIFILSCIALLIVGVRLTRIVLRKPQG